jgi:hypothetical protein
MGWTFEVAGNGDVSNPNNFRGVCGGAFWERLETVP